MVKARNVFSFMFFLCLFNLHLLRLNLMVTIIAMVNSTALDTEASNVSSEICPSQYPTADDAVAKVSINDYGDNIASGSQSN